MSNKQHEKITQELDDETSISAEETESESKSGLTPRQIKKRIARIAGMDDAKKAKSHRKRLIWNVMKAIADGSATPARRCAQVLVEAYSAKTDESSPKTVDSLTD